MVSRITRASAQSTVFISSTYVDLKAYRDKVEESLNRLETNFRSMKFFGSKEGEPLEQCLEKLRQCSYYVAIVGHRYGEIHPEFKLSYTELEYDEAKRSGLARRVYLAGSSVLLNPQHVETDDRRKQLETFKQRLKKENTVVFFENPDDLATKVVSDILLSFSDKVGIASFAGRKYLPAIRATCASISFLGLDIQTMKRHKDVGLEKVYVQSKFGEIGDPADLPVPTRKTGDESLSPLASRPTREGLSISQILSRAPCLVVLGDPGSGKTTLAKYLVTGLVDRLSDVADSIHSTLSIRVPLRSYSEYRHRAGGIGVTILGFMEAFAKTELQLDSLPEGFFEFYLERRDCLLVFDGLDEIVDAHLREQVRNDIVAFTQISYPGNHTVITSRKVGYEEAGLSRPDFRHFEVLPFDDTQIAEYIRKWYRMEETDKGKRTEELSAFEKARQNLPKELLSNPLLLSLIVILFRSGCTLPESKLEIYRSCIGTLTEKWDAAGKRLELPERYNRVRDKKNAFARIAYWMYKQQTLGSGVQQRMKYPDLVGELARYLCEREFKGAESDAQQAAEDFFEYSAKRSVFVEDRFSHKTFHEYFAALYIYRNFCLGKTVDDLFQEIMPYLGSDSWAVVLELLLLMLDEQSGPLLDAVLDRVMDEVKAGASDESYDLLLVPLRILGQLQNIGPTKAEELVSSSVDFCARAPISDTWIIKGNKEGPHQRIFSALEKLPQSFYPIVVRTLRRSAERGQTTTDLLAVAVFRYEFPFQLGAELADIIPNWSDVGESLAKLHLSAFYALFPHLVTPYSQRIPKFVEYFGEEKLFMRAKVFFRPTWEFVPVAELTLLQLGSGGNIAPYDESVGDFLSVEIKDFVLSGLIRRSTEIPTGSLAALEGVMEHFSSEWSDSQRYLVDWLILIRAMKGKNLDARLARRCRAKLRSIKRRGNSAQRFYSALLLSQRPKELSAKELGVSDSTRECLHEFIEVVNAPSLDVRQKPQN